MNPTITSAIIGAVALILGSVITAIVGPIVVKKFQNKRFQKQREREGILNIQGTWETKWYLKDQLLHKGLAELDTGESYYRLEGSGTSPERSIEGYSISGAVDSSRFFLMTYKNNSFPTVGYIGVAILRVSLDGNSMEGTWSGRTGDREEIQTGRVEWILKKR